MMQQFSGGAIAIADLEIRDNISVAIEDRKEPQYRVRLRIEKLGNEAGIVLDFRHDRLDIKSKILKGKVPANGIIYSERPYKTYFTKQLLYFLCILLILITMRLLIVTQFAFVCALLSCGSEDEDGAPRAGNAPQWAAESPVLATGATTMDINVSTDRSALVYYVIADKPLTLTPAQVKQHATTPLSSGIKASGVIESKTSETRKTISQLLQHSNYHAYFVAQNIGDTIHQQTVTYKSFKTFVRQDTSEYTSTVENRKVKYLIYRPEEVLKYPEKQYPMLYTLSGNGEVATDDKPMNLIRNGSVPEYIYKGNDVPMMVMSIQHTAQNWNVAMIDEAIVYGNKTFPVDPKRVYLTGMSGGGYGCWSYAQAHPEKLAAIVPISGGGNLSKACTLKDVPVWAFHNQTDNVVPSTNTTNMVKNLNGCPPAKEVKQLLFPDTGHDCWRRVYDKNHANWSKSPGVERMDIYAWLLTKTK